MRSRALLESGLAANASPRHAVVLYCDIGISLEVFTFFAGIDRFRAEDFFRENCCPFSIAAKHLQHLFSKKPFVGLQTRLHAHGASCSAR